MKLIIFTDGASRGNPGPASYGFVIKDSRSKIIHQQGEYIGTATNNIAEYSGVLEALKWVERRFHNQLPVQIDLFADSRLVAEQLSGRFKIKNSGLKILFDQIKVLELNLGQATYTHVYRAANSQADALANKALDQRK